MRRLLRRLGTACWLWFVFFAATAQPVRAVAFDDGWQITNGDALVGEAVSFSYVPGRVERFVAASPGETVVFAVQVNNEATNSIGYQQIIADSWGITLSAGGVNASEGGQTVGIFSVSLELQVPDGETGVTISLEGQDLGMWVGYYGPVFYDPSIEVRPAASGAVKVEVYQFDNAPPPLLENPVICPGSMTSTRTIDFDWGGDIVADCAYDQVVVHFSGEISIPERMLVVILHDDGGILKFNGDYWIDAWYDTGCQWDNVWTDPGTYSFDFWFYENGGGACARMGYVTESGEFAPIPADWFIGQPTTTTSTSTTTSTIAETTTTWQPTTTFTEPTTTSSTIVETTSAPVTTEETTSLPPEAFTTTTPTAPPTSEQPVVTPPTGTTIPTATLPVTTTQLPTPTSSEPSPTTLPALETTTVPETVPGTATSAPPTTSDSPVTEPPGTIPELESPEELVDFLEEVTVEELANLSAEAIDELVADIGSSDLTEEQASVIAEVLSSAPEEVKEAFQEAINVYGGTFDNYVPTGSNVSVAERRRIIAVVATVALPLTPIAPSSTGASSRKQR